MYPLKRFHLKLTAKSNWQTELGTSLTEVMAHIATYDTMPYMYFTTVY